jgi:hypothetical protein
MAEMLLEWCVKATASCMHRAEKGSSDCRAAALSAQVSWASSQEGMTHLYCPTLNEEELQAAHKNAPRLLCISVSCICAERAVGSSSDCRAAAAFVQVSWTSAQEG